MEDTAISLHIRASIAWTDLLPPSHLLRHIAADDALSREIFGYAASDQARQLQEVRQRYRTRRDDLVAVLRRLHARLGASAATLHNLDRLSQPHTFVVIGGQQPGLLTGPLYTVYKAISIIRLAEELGRQFPYEFVPLFWSATDDHDWAEVDHVYLFDGNHQLHRVEYPRDPRYEGWSVGDVPLDHGALHVIERLAEVLRGQGFVEDVTALLLETAEVSPTFGEWFCRLMLSLFHRHGLIIVDPRLPELKQLAIPLFELALEDPLLPTQLANETGDELEARGFRRQLHKDAVLCGFFLQEDGRREAVRYGRSGFRVGARTYTKAELKAILHDSPERFSPNALLRPVMSEYLFPTAAFVGGAGELSYFAQTRRIYQHFNVSGPVPYLRLGAAMVDAPIARILDKYQLAPLSLRDPDQALAEWIRARVDIASPALWQGLREEVYRPFVGLKEAVRAIDPTLETSLEGTLNYMLFRIGKFEKKLIRHLKKAEQITATHMRRAAQVLYPGQGLQERTLNGMSWLSRYGMELVDELVETVPASYGKHFIVELS